MPSQHVPDPSRATAGEAHEPSGGDPSDNAAKHPVTEEPLPYKPPSEPRPYTDTDTGKPDGRNDLSDGILKWLTLSVAALAALGGILSYREGVNATKQTSTDLYQRPFFDQQFQLYLQTSDICATLATTTDEPLRQRETAQFESIYWGKMSLVEDQKVQDRMIDFEEALQAVPHPHSTRDLIGLQRASYELSHEFRRSLSQYWPVPPQDIRDEQPNPQQTQPPFGV